MLLHGKGKLGNGLLHYKKMSIGNFCYCAAVLDKSRRLNSFIQSGSIIGRISDIMVTCTCGQARGRCSCLVTHVSLHVEVFRSVRSVIKGKYNSSGAVFVQAEPTGRFVTVAATSVTKCVVVNHNGTVYMCTLWDELVLEAK